jgi:hypothetical protein
MYMVRNNGAQRRSHGDEKRATFLAKKLTDLWLRVSVHQEILFSSPHLGGEGINGWARVGVAGTIYQFAPGAAVFPIRCLRTW